MKKKHLKKLGNTIIGLLLMAAPFLLFKDIDIRPLHDTLDTILVIIAGCVLAAFTLWVWEYEICWKCFFKADWMKWKARRKAKKTLV